MMTKGAEIVMMARNPARRALRPVALVSLVGVVGLMALAVGLAGSSVAADAPAAASGPAASAATKPALSVTVVTAQAASWPQTVAANGNIAAWQEAIVGAEAAGLRLTSVPAQVGDRVKRGQLLAQLQSSTLTADLAATRAGLAEARALAAEAMANAERARQLQEPGAISAQQMLQFVTAEQTARARVQALQARLDADRVRLAQTRVLAPDDGIISARAATVGAVVQPGQELFRLIRQGRLEWRAEVAAADLARITRGQPVALQPVGGTPLRGTVRMVAPTVDPATRNGLVHVDLPRDQAGAKAGMFARGEFELGATRGLTLPQSAVLLRDGFAYVFKVGADNKLAMAKVSTGRRVGDRVEITAGLDAQARVVASGVGFLGDGDAVRVVAALPAGGPAGK
jgi:RND family efflux transporter MFP subunit